MGRERRALDAAGRVRPGLGTTLKPILTNMDFRQSPLWRAQAQSVYCAPADNPSKGSAVREAWTLFRQVKTYDVVMTMGIRTAMIYGALCAVTGRPPKQVMTEIFIDAPRPHNPFWHLKTALYRRLARRAWGLIAFSTAETRTLAARYQLDPERVRFVPFCSPIDVGTYPETDPPYVFSGGRTSRDYALLLEMATCLPEIPFVVVCGKTDLSTAATLPNLTIHREIPKSEYLKWLQGAALVVLPLQPTERSTGQVVLLEAMACGKAVITSRTPGTEDYLVPGVSGEWVPPGDTNRMVSLCQQLWEDNARRRQLGTAARAAIEARHLPDHHAQGLLDAITAFTPTRPAD